MADTTADKEIVMKSDWPSELSDVKRLNVSTLLGNLSQKGDELHRASLAELNRRAHHYEAIDWLLLTARYAINEKVVAGDKYKIPAANAVSVKMEAGAILQMTEAEKLFNSPISVCLRNEWIEKRGDHEYMLTPYGSLKLRPQDNTEVF